MPEYIDAWTKREECSLQYPLIGPLWVCGVLNIDMDARISVLYDLKLTKEVVVGILERTPP